jgi:hypothetical protein
VPQHSGTSNRFGHTLQPSGGGEPLGSLVLEHTGIAVDVLAVPRRGDPAHLFGGWPIDVITPDWARDTARAFWHSTEPTR